MDTEILNNLEHLTNGHAKPQPAPEPQVADELKPLAVRDEGDEEYVYVFNFVKPSSYWNAAELAKQYIAPGEIVDLGRGPERWGRLCRKPGLATLVWNVPGVDSA